MAASAETQASATAWVQARPNDRLDDAARRRRLIRGVLTALLVAACAYRVWLIVRFNPLDQVWSDSARHWLEGTRPLDASPMAAIDPIVYQIYIGILGKLTLQSPLLVAYWTALLSLAGPWLWYRFLRELIVDREWALAGWVAFAALPSWAAIYSYFMQETLMLPLLGAALWATWRCRRKGDTASFVLATCFWLLAGLTRGICFPLAAVAMTWLWFTQGNKRARAAISLAIVIGCLGPLAARSWSIARLISPHGIGQLAHIYQLAGTASISFEFTRRQGSEHWVYEFISPSMSHPPFAPFSDWRGRREANTHVAIDLDAGSRDWQAAKASLPPWSFARATRLTTENLAHLFFGPSWPDSDIEGNLRRDVGKINYWMRWLWAPLTIACLFWTLARWRREPERMLPTLLVVWIFVQGLFPLTVNEGRYRKPFEGLLLAQCLLLAAGGRARARDYPSRAESPR